MSEIDVLNAIEAKFEIGDSIIEKQTGRIFGFYGTKIFTWSDGAKYECYVYFGNIKGRRQLGGEYLKKFLDDFELYEGEI